MEVPRHVSSRKHTGLAIQKLFSLFACPIVFMPFCGCQGKHLSWNSIKVLLTDLIFVQPSSIMVKKIHIKINIILRLMYIMSKVSKINQVFCVRHNVNSGT